jgi:hypothetical protein
MAFTGVIASAIADFTRRSVQNLKLSVENWDGVRGSAGGLK